MADQRSWAEGKWWRGAKRDYFGVLVLAVLILFGLHAFTLHQMGSPPLQQFYIGAYRASCTIVRRPMALPYVQQANGARRLASLQDVVVLPSTPSGRLRLTLSNVAVTSGVHRVQFVRISGAGLNQACTDLSRQIQANRLAVRTRIPPLLLGALVVCSFGLVVSVYRARGVARRMRHGHALRGPQLVTRLAFNRLKRADGISFYTQEGGWLERAFGTAVGERRELSIRSQEESSHFLLMGDTGSGKSSLIRQLLQQVADRDEAAVVYDPALEFTPQFFRPERGDRILNPLDARMPYWCPGDEIQHKAEALGFAKALFPEDRRDNKFFIESPRKIFARLLSFRPTAQEIAHWLQHHDEIDRLLSGTELASMIDACAPSQRAGVLASLSMIGDSFQLIPDRTDTTGQWSAYEWAQHRKGWLFITSTPQTIDRLRPLITVWLDLLLMRLLAGGPPVWVFMDELPTLNKLPKLPEALALARKPNVRLVIGFQGRAQLEARYGPESEAMLSQPATKVFLRTSEPRAAEWISKALGEIEFERLRETVNYDKYLPTLYHRKGHGYSLDRQTRPLVLASEISGLSNLTAYLKSENYVVKFRFAPNPVRPKQPALIPRPINPTEWPQRPAVETRSDREERPGEKPRSSAGNSSRLQPRNELPRRVSPQATIEHDPYFE